MLIDTTIYVYLLTSFSAILWLELSELKIGLIRPSFLNFLALQESSQSTRWAVLFSVGVSSLGMVYPVDDRSGRLSGMGGNDDVDEFDCWLSCRLEKNKSSCKNS